MAEPYHGLEAVLNWHNVALKLAVFFLSRVPGLLYIANSVKNKVIFDRTIKQIWYNQYPFLSSLHLSQNYYLRTDLPMTAQPDSFNGTI